MFRKLISLSLACLLTLTVCANPTAASTLTEKEARLVEKLKSNVAKLGTGPEARIEVVLRDKTKLKGYVSEAVDDSFVVVDAKTNVPTRVAYPQVKKAKGNNLSQNATFALVLVGLVVFVTIVLVSGRGRG